MNYVTKYCIPTCGILRVCPVQNKWNISLQDNVDSE